VQAGTPAQPTTWWLSASDDYDKYAIGTLTDDALEYTIASRQVNQIVWVSDNNDLFLGSIGAEFRARGGANGEILGGDVIPLVDRITAHGSAPIQPVALSRRSLFVDLSRKKIITLGYTWEEDAWDADELTDIAEHITGSGIRLGQIGFAKRPHPTLYFVREDGQLISLMYFKAQRVIGFSRLITDGFFEAVSVTPDPNRGPDRVTVIVRRTISGATKRYVEGFQPVVSGLSLRGWTSLQTDSAVIYDASPTTTIPGLSHLEGKTVDVIADAGYRGTKLVTGGQIILDEAASEVEVGLHYDSAVTSMRPAIQGSIIEGLPRSWDKLWVRLKSTIGGLVNGERIQYVPSDLDALGLFTGDRDVTGQGWDTEGRVTVQQDQPYPMTILGIFGELSVGDHG
jgi:hypothetical protein